MSQQNKSNDLSGYRHGIHNQVRPNDFQPQLRWQEDPAYSFDRITPQLAGEDFSSVQNSNDDRLPYANSRILPEIHQSPPIYQNSNAYTDWQQIDNNTPIQQSNYNQQYINYNGLINNAEISPNQCTVWRPNNYNITAFGHYPLQIYHHPPLYQHGYQNQPYQDYESSSNPQAHPTVTHYQTAFNQSQRDFIPFQRSTRNLDQSSSSAEPLKESEHSIPARSCPCRKPNHAFMVVCEDPQHDIHSPGAVYVHTLCAKEQGSTWTCNACQRFNSPQLGATPTSNLPNIEASPTPAPVSRNRISSRRLGRPPKAANPEKKQKGAWTATEESACIQSMRKIRTPGYTGTIDELWVLISAEMQRRGIQRTAGAVKNQWNRKLRSKSRFDERVKQNPQRLVTGALNYKRQAQRRFQISTQRINHARTNAQLAAHDSDSTISASGSDRIFPRNSDGQDPITPPLSHSPQDSSSRSADQSDVTDASEEPEE